jgi:hypothetical protein
MFRQTLPVFMAVLVALSACAGTPGPPAPPSPKEQAISACVDACRQALSQGREIGPGPCLLDPIPGLDDWVCDVAHSPRKAVDLQSANQCPGFRAAYSAHFVEVDPECNLITAK